MREISIDDCFGQAIAKYSQGLDFGVEIGGGTGDGSTQCIKTERLWSLEVHPVRVGRHGMNLSMRHGGTAMHCLSSNPKLWMSRDDVENFYNTTHTNLNSYPIEMVLGWLDDDLAVASNYKWSPLTPVIDIDFLLLDGGAFSGRADFMDWMPLVRRDGIIALDDINDIKNHWNFNWLKEAGHDLLWVDKAWRNGCAIFRK
ncbi:hypothetical protein EBQ81_04120 [bacterium]|nr:hypothetical protein [bacterium]